MYSNKVGMASGSSNVTLQPINAYFYRPQHGHFPMMPFMPNAMPQRIPANDEEDLASVSLQIQKKRFYVDVKKNRKGRFMKIAEVGLDGKKARILLTMPAAVELKDKLKDLIDALEEVQQKEENDSSTDSGNQGERSDSTVNDGLIKSYTLVYPKRRYFLDLKRNKRGFFLRLTMMTSYIRVQLAVPAEGMTDLYNAVSELLDKWYDSAAKSQDQIQFDLPASKSLRVDNKTMYFDSVANRSGIFLRISEVRSNYRTSISFPAKYITKFQEVIEELGKDLEGKLHTTDSNNNSNSEHCDPHDCTVEVVPANEDTVV